MPLKICNHIYKAPKLSNTIIYPCRFVLKGDTIDKFHRYYILLRKRCTTGLLAQNANANQGPQDLAEKKCNPCSVRHLLCFKWLNGAHGPLSTLTTPQGLPRKQCGVRPTGAHHEAETNLSKTSQAQQPLQRKPITMRKCVPPSAEKFVHISMALGFDHLL